MGKVDSNSLNMILLPSTKLAIFLGLEHPANIDAQFP